MRIPEIPCALEEAAFVDRSSGLYGRGRHRRLCRISSWNDFGFAMTLNNNDAKATVWSVVDERRCEPTVVDKPPLTSWGSAHSQNNHPAGKNPRGSERDELLACLDHLLDAAGNPSPIQSVPRCDSAAKAPTPTPADRLVPRRRPID
jgi:hypothetical protein